MEILGNYTIRSFDEGLVKTLGCYIDEIEHKGEKRKQYFINVDGLKSASGVVASNKVPVYFVIVSQAEIFPEYIIPAVVIKRTRLSMSSDRWFNPHKIIYPAEGAKEYRYGNKVGYDRYLEIDSYAPFDFQYSIQGIARYQSDANVLLNYLLRRLKYPWSWVYVEDSNKNFSSFEARVEGIDYISELVDVAEKLIGFNITLTVWAELPVSEPEISKSVLERKINVNFLGG